jgi:hypothetical protein
LVQLSLFSLYGVVIALSCHVGLASNRLEGTLLSNFGTITGTVDLTINRLSGFIPSTLLVASNVDDDDAGAQSIADAGHPVIPITASTVSINFLSGNLFQCMESAILHSQDPDRTSYVCGSSNFESSVIAFTCSMAICAIACMCLHVDKNLAIRVCKSLCGQRSENDQKPAAASAPSTDPDGKGDVAPTVVVAASSSRKALVKSSASSQRMSHRMSQRMSQRSSLMSPTERSSMFFSAPLSEMSLRTAAAELQLAITAPTPVGKHTVNFLGFLSEASLCAVVIGAFDLCVCLVAYVFMKDISKGDANSHLSTHFEQYAWITTAAFLHGSVPAVVVCLFVVLCLLACRGLMPVLNAGRSAASRQLDEETEREALQREESYRQAQQQNQQRTKSRQLERVSEEGEGSGHGTSSRAPSIIQMTPRGEPLSSTAGAGVDVTQRSMSAAQDDTSEGGREGSEKGFCSRMLSALGSCCGCCGAAGIGPICLHKSSRTFVLLTLMHLCNFLVTLIINFLYVFGIFEGVSRTVLLATQLAVSIVKLAWTRISIPRYDHEVCANARCHHVYVVVVFAQSDAEAAVHADQDKERAPPRHEPGAVRGGTHRRHLYW